MGTRKSWREVATRCAGSTDRTIEKTYMFSHIDARYIRIKPVAWHGRISMRAGVLVRLPSLYPYKLFGKSNFFGEKEVLLGPGARAATLRCESDGQLLVLS